MKNKWTFLLIILIPIFSFSQVLDVQLCEQEQTSWCWAGTSQCVLYYYGNNYEQCEIAEYTRNTATFHDFGSTDCCVDPDGDCNYWNYMYDYAGSIESILLDMGDPSISNVGMDDPLSEQACIDNLGLNRPFFIRVKYGSGGHFLVGHGYQNGNLYYMDPWFGEGFGYTSFGTSVAGGTWTHSLYMTVSPSGSTSCGVPSGLNASDIGETSATLNWGSVSGAQSYDIQYKQTSAGSWTSTSSTSNSKLIIGLAAGTQYEFQVRTVCSDGTSDYSGSSTFTTDNEVSGNTVGNTTVFTTTTNATNRRAASYTMPEDGTIESISMYHKAGSGSMILGIYDGDTDPTNLLGKTAAVSVSGSDGWQTVNLLSPVSVSGGTTIWLAWVLEENSGIIVYESGSVPRSDAGVGWSAGMPDSWGSSSLANYSYSIYASYNPGTVQVCGVPSGLDASNITENSAVLTWSGTASATSYRIQYREVGAGTWTTVTSSSASTEISGLTGDTQYEFQVQSICSFGDSQYSGTETFTTLGGGTTTETVGNTTIFGTTTNVTNRRAASYTMPESGTIQSISLYHKAGSGSIILGVYEGDSSPTNLLGKTAVVTVSGSDGWQTVNLETPVHVAGGKKIWLAWVLQYNSGIIVYQRSRVYRADAGVGWSSGMPDPFGSSTLAKYSYSIYATYIPD